MGYFSFAYFLQCYFWVSTFLSQLSSLWFCTSSLVFFPICLLSFLIVLSHPDLLTCVLLSSPSSYLFKYVFPYLFAMILLYISLHFQHFFPPCFLCLPLVFWTIFGFLVLPVSWICLPMASDWYLVLILTVSSESLPLSFNKLHRTDPALPACPNWILGPIL